MTQPRLRLPLGEGSLSGRKAVLSVPQNQQAAVFYGNPCLFPGKMVADSQRESGSQGAVFQGVVQPPDIHALRVRAQTENGNGAPASCGERQAAILETGDSIVTRHGESHSVACYGETPLVLLAVILPY